MSSRIMFLEPPLPEEQAELRQESSGSPHPDSCPCRAAMTEEMGTDKIGEIGQDSTNKGHIWEREGPMGCSPLHGLVTSVGGWCVRLALALTKPQCPSLNWVYHKNPKEEA